jgi:transcriptional regulator with XRE-family HTH domain
MHPIEHIRRNVLKLTQAGLADLAGVSQGTVSRWEQGKLEPTREELARIREQAKRSGKKWRDNWFFEVPEDKGAA